MAFNKDYFQSAGGQGKRGKAPQQFTYATEDAATVIDTVGYFNSVSSILSVGDQISTTIFSDLSAKTVSGYALHIVNSITGGVVDVANASVTNTIADTD